MFRILFFLLILGNLLFFAWSQGHFGVDTDGREPQRLAQQVQPEKLRIVREPGALSSVSRAGDLACRMISGLTLADVDLLKKHIESIGGKAHLATGTEPPVFVVLIPDLPGKLAAQRKAAELNRIGVNDFMLAAVGGDRHEIIFESASDEAAANEKLAQLVKVGVRSARIDRRSPPSATPALELRLPAGSLEQQLKGFAEVYPAAVVSACPAPTPAAVQP